MAVVIGFRDDGHSIEIISNARGHVEDKIWHRGDWGANSSPGVHSFTMSQAKMSF